MKRLFPILVAGLAMLATSCSFQVPSGFVGILYDKYGSNKGVQAEAYDPGVWSYNPLTQEYQTYPTFQTVTKFQDRGDDATFDGVSFAAKDGNEVKQEIAITAYTDKAHAPVLFQKYREDLPDILNLQVKQRLRDYFNQFAVAYNVEDIYGEKRTELLQHVEKAIREEFGTKGIIIDNVSYLSKPKFSPQVETAIESKIVTQQATLNAQLKVAQATADAEATVAKARGEAEANKIMAASLSPQILDLMALQNQAKFIEALQAGKAAMPTTYVTSADRTFLPIK